jgi:hypothetical protein
MVLIMPMSSLRPVHYSMATGIPDLSP